MLWSSCGPLLSLSILRKALDKIAEIKSLLEERRIGELEMTSQLCIPCPGGVGLPESSSHVFPWGDL